MHNPTSPGKQIHTACKIKTIKNYKMLNFKKIELYKTYKTSIQMLGVGQNT